MVKKTVNLTMAVANDNGNGFAKTYLRYEDGSEDVNITPSIFAPVSGQGYIPDLDQSNLEDFSKSMEVVIKSTAIKSTAEYLVGESAINSGNALKSYNVEANTGKAESDITVIVPFTKIAYAALTHSVVKMKSIPSTINVNITHFIRVVLVKSF